MMGNRQSFVLLIIALSLMCVLRSEQALAVETRFDFDIKRQSLSTALLDFSYQSNTQLIMPGYLAESRVSRRVSGMYSPTEALDILLKGSNLEYEFTSENTVTIRRSAKKPQPLVRRRRPVYSEFEVEQLLVTAEGPEELLRDIAVSSVALSGEDLESRGITKADELQQFIPGLTVESPQIGNTEFSIRGVGASNDDLSTQPGVGVFIDDIYIPRQGPANLALYDLDRVEVLRGPQSTIYGRNATGGALHYITRKPSPDFEARYLVDIGNKGRFNNTVTVNGTVTDKLFGQFSVASFQRDGIMDNRNPGQPDGNDIDSLSMRASARVLATKNTELLFTVDKEDTENNGVLYSIGPTEPFQLAAGLPAVPASQPVRSADVTLTGGEKLDVGGAMARANVKTDKVHASYILGFRTHELSGVYDLDQLRADLVNKALSEESDLDTLEVRFTSPRQAKKLRASEWDWLLGAYVFNESAIASKLFDAPGLGIGSNRWDQAIDNRSYAAYGQLTYAVSDTLRLIAGGRYTVDFKEFDLNAVSDNPSPANPYIQENFIFSTKRDWRRITPKLAVTYDYDTDTLLYASLSTGYKPGGYFGTPANLVEAQQDFNLESVDNFELGLRSTLFANRLKVSLAGFIAEYKDLQVSGFDNVGNNFISNAPETDIKGFELEMQARFTANLKLGVGLSFINARFDDFELALDGEQLNKAGDRVPRVPDATANISAVYFFPETRHGFYSLRADAVYSEEAVGIRSEPAWPSYRTFNLWFDFSPQSALWSAGLWVRNATDETYFQAASPGITAQNDAFARKLEPPRLYGASFKYFW